MGEDISNGNSERKGKTTMTAWYLPPRVGEVVQFNEKHKWAGALGIVSEVKQCGEDYRVMIGATIPDNEAHCNTAYIFSMLNDKEFDFIGDAVLMPPKEEDE